MHRNLVFLSVSVDGIKIAGKTGWLKTFVEKS